MYTKCVAKLGDDELYKDTFNNWIVKQNLVCENVNNYWISLFI